MTMVTSGVIHSVFVYKKQKLSANAELGLQVFYIAFIGTSINIVVSSLACNFIIGFTFVVIILGPYFMNPLTRLKTFPSLRLNDDDSSRSSPFFSSDKRLSLLLFLPDSRSRNS